LNTTSRQTFGVCHATGHGLPGVKELAKTREKDFLMRFNLSAFKYRAEDDLERSVSVKMLDYITPGIWITFVMAGVAVWSTWTLVTSAFSSGAVLNGSIIATGLIGVMRSVWSNVRLWITARYLQSIDDVKKQTSPVDEAQMLQFRRKLKKEGALLDTKQMADLLENLPTMGG
jgi:hypothetical protein